MQVFKLTHSIDNVDCSYLFEINNTNFEKQFCKTNCRKYSFSQRILNYCNSLPQIVVQNRNLNSFKSGIDGFLPTIYNERIRITNTLPIRRVYVQST